MPLPCILLWYICCVAFNVAFAVARARLKSSLQCTHNFCATHGLHQSRARGLLYASRTCCVDHRSNDGSRLYGARRSLAARDAQQCVIRAKRPLTAHSSSAFKRTAASLKSSSSSCSSLYCSAAASKISFSFSSMYFSRADSRNSSSVSCSSLYAFAAASMISSSCALAYCSRAAWTKSSSPSCCSL